MPDTKITGQWFDKQNNVVVIVDDGLSLIKVPTLVPADVIAAHPDRYVPAEPHHFLGQVQARDDAPCARCGATSEETCRGESYQDCVREVPSNKMFVCRDCGAPLGEDHDTTCGLASGPMTMTHATDTAIERPVPDANLVEDMAMLIRQLALALRRQKPNHPLPTKAVDFLKRKGLAGSALR